MRFFSLSGVVVGLFFLASLAAVAQDKPPRTAPLPISDDPAPVKIEKAFPNLKFDRPIFVTYPPDGTNRLAVLCEKGEIFMMPNDASVEEPESMLDIKEKVTYKDRENEEGMLGLAFH